MSALTPDSSEPAAGRGVNIIVGNTVDEDGRQFINCQPGDLLTAKINIAAKKALQCLGPMQSGTIEQLSRDFSQSGNVSIDVHQADSSRPFRGTGRTLHTIEGAGSN